MTCLHDDTKGNTLLGCFTVDDHEIYLCECGALVNLLDSRNLQAGHVMIAMTAKEISDMVLQQMSALIVHIEKEILTTQEQALKELLKKYV